MPIATGLHDSQTRLGQQRAALDGRIEEISKVIDLTNSRTAHIEDSWRLSGQPANKLSIAQLAQLREGDAALLSSPLILATAPNAKASKPLSPDTVSIETMISDLDKFGKERKTSVGELINFAGSVNTELSKLEKEQADAAKASVYC
jgi:hypothetical protein